MISWPTVPLEDLVKDKQISYGVVQPGRNIEDGIPIVRVKDIRNGHIASNDPLLIDRAIAERHSKTTLSGGELLFSLVGTVGETAIVPQSLSGWNTARAVAVLRPVSASSHWIQLCLKSPKTRSIIDSMLNTTVQATLNLADLKKIPISMPPASVRNGIIEVLGALDDKITANNTLSQNLKELAQAEFTQLIKTAEIVGNLRDVLHLEYGKSLPAKNRIDGEVEVFGSGGKVGTHNESLSSGPGVIVGRKGTAGAVYWAPNAYFPIDTTFYVVPTDQDFSLIFCFHLLKSLNLNDMNSDSAVPGLNREEALSSPIKIPTMGELKNFSTRADFLFTVAQQLNLESQALNSMRDTLLPQLMSGKIRVREAESIVEGVL